MSASPTPWRVIAGEDNESPNAHGVWGTIIDANHQHVARIWDDVSGGREQAAASAALLVATVNQYTSPSPSKNPVIQECIAACKTHFDVLCELDDPRLYDVVEGLEITIDKLERL